MVRFAMLARTFTHPERRRLSMGVCVAVAATMLALAWPRDAQA
jgi:hypothetical protein